MSGSPNDFARLQARLEELERRNRRGRWLTGTLAAGAAALALTSAAAPTFCKTVWAERFVLKDGHDRTRVVLDAYGREKPAMTFKDAQGRDAARLEIDDAGALELQVFEAGKPTGATFRLQERGEKGGVD